MNRLRLLGLVAACLAIVACGGGPEGPSPLGAPSRLELPAEWLRSTGDEELPPLTAAQHQLVVDTQLLENAAGIIAAECMAAQGFRYEPTAVPVDRQTDPFADGRLDPAVTEVEGYGDILGSSDQGDAGFEPEDAPTERYVASLSAEEQEAFQRAFFGTETQAIEVDGGVQKIPADGCLADGRREVAGEAFADWVATSDALSNAIALAVEEVEASDELRVADERWSACMADAGYDYANEDEAINEAAQRFEPVDGVTRVVSDEEQDLATADARCRLGSDMIDTIVRVQRDRERRILTTVEVPILAWLEARDDVLARVEDTLRTGGR